MAKAIALTRAQFNALTDPFEVARMVIVAGCALSLILAQGWLPF